MATITPLYNVMVKEEVTDENLAECRKVIYSLMSMENKVWNRFIKLECLYALPESTLSTKNFGKFYAGVKKR